MQKIQHKLSLTIKTPKTAKEGDDFDFILRVKNIGDTKFSGTITIQLLWQSLQYIIPSHNFTKFWHNNYSTTVAVVARKTV